MEGNNALVPVEETKRNISTSTQTYGGLVPRNLDELWRVAVWISKSGMAPKGLQTPEAISVAIQMGLEVGMKVMQSVQNIAVINGRPSIWGDAALALCRASGEVEKFKEWFTGEKYTDNWTAHCMVKRKGDDEDDVANVSFSYEEAKRAKLVPAHADSPWTKYPGRMLQMRARSWPLRDKFTDVLKGLQVAEESSDVVVMTETSNGSFSQEPEKLSGKAALKAKLKKKAPEPEVKEPEVIDPAKTPEDIPPESHEDAPEIAQVILEGSLSSEPEDGEEEAVAAPSDPEPEPPQAIGPLTREQESAIYHGFKSLKTPGFEDWIQKNVQNRDVWTMYISENVEAKCKTCFGMSLDEKLEELSVYLPTSNTGTENPEPSSPPPSKTPPPNESLDRKIGRIVETLAQEYAEISEVTVQDWMQASWECDLADDMFKITHPIADAILADLSSAEENSLIPFANM